MDPRLLGYYNRELRFMREMGGELAAEFPKIAARLGLESFECADPYVERLLEGFAYLAARVQLKIDAEFPAFTQHFLEMVYPHYLAPTPSMAVVELQPDLDEGALAEGFDLPRDTVLRGTLGRDAQTACEYRTAHPVRLWPMELTAAEYFSHTGPVAKADLPALKRSKAGIRLRLRTTANLTFAQLAPGRPERFQLVLFLQGADQLPFELYARLLGDTVAVLVQPTARPLPWIETLPATALRPLGFADDESLLPYAPASFQGYRNLHEYFAFPQRYLFIAIDGLGPVLRRLDAPEVDLILLLGQPAPGLERVLDAANFALHCSPAINLFPKRLDRIHLNATGPEQHLVPDRTRPLDFEVYRVDSVTGYGSGTTAAREFRPFYAPATLAQGGGPPAYYSVHRVPRRLSSRQQRRGTRSSYVGSEVFINLVDAAQAPWSAELRQLAVTGLCTNRDLPLLMPVGTGKTDFTLESGAPVRAVRVRAGPTPPRPSHAHGDTAWRLISHLSLNYLSLADTDGGQGAAALRELLGLYGGLTDADLRKQVDGILRVSSRPIVRRLPGVRPVTYGRGLEVAVECDETAFEGTGAFLLGAVLARFFARYCSINAFTETVLKTGRGELMRWPAIIGRRPTL
ncbi:type VI secretion system baseplate subunit TssF [Candidatus Thiodictyon syntrophicum]|jgi:type VI secretion system protein ImpG|uniref:Type VI secretion system protein ImpG n=1 Tax=Candidatus Thiodictyon syntrophicum TaxID=1166950 RepID=A0A2K8UJD4_9GAMM|nr:type VI secretion system baseplate subunit TssF [Candidatus Thiodictyon syntrophicum]AUB85632.1 type VI secretion system protein ImpG [Candidatus Thiodictyon syntrophicum]